MKKYFLFVMAVLAGLFTSCKEEMAPALVEGDTNVTIKVQAPQQNLGTRSGATAFADPALSDMRVALIISTTDNQVVTVTTKTHSFGTGSTACTFDARLYKGKTYNISVWADYGSTYYTIPTQPTTKDEAAATKPVIKMASLSIDSCSNQYDAYFGNVTTALTDNGDINVSLKRPFALVKVNTADWNENAVKLANYRPDHYATTFSAPTQLDLVSGVADSVKNIAVAAAIVAYDADAATKELHYNYLFANEASSILPKFTVDYKQGSTTNSDYEFENIPVQRNYKTNIVGNILTKNGKINVTVDPMWAATVYQIDVRDIEGANDAIEENVNAGNTNIDINFKSQPNDAGTPGEAGAKAILTTPLPENATLSINIESETKSLYVGDYENESSTTIQTENVKAAVVNINVPQDSKIETLVINAPSKTVYVNGKLVSNVGVIDHIDAITSMNTLIIAPDQHVKLLTMRKGGLEIHGQVDEAEVILAEGDQVEVRDCENLPEEKVYNVLKDYIAPNYTSAQNPNGTWNIFKKEVVKNTATNVIYTSLATAIEKANSGETLQIIADIDKAEGKFIFPEDKVLTLDLNGHTVNAVGDNKGIWSEVRGKLTITGAGYLGDTSHEVYGYLFHVYGELILNATATFESGLEVAETRSAEAKIYIHKGRYIGDEYEGHKWTFNKKDTYATSSIIEIDGGEFVDFDPSDPRTESPAQNWVKEGYVAESDGATPPVFTVKDFPVILKTKAGKSYGYTSLADAMLAAEAAGMDQSKEKYDCTISIYQDLTEVDRSHAELSDYYGCCAVGNSCKFTIDGNNHTIQFAQATGKTKKSKGIFSILNGDITISNLKVNKASECCFYFGQTAIAHLENITMLLPSNGLNFNISGSTVLYLTDCTLTYRIDQYDSSVIHFMSGSYPAITSTNSRNKIHGGSFNFRADRYLYDNNLKVYYENGLYHVAGSYPEGQCAAELVNSSNIVVKYYGEDGGNVALGASGRNSDLKHEPITLYSNANANKALTRENSSIAITCENGAIYSGTISADQSWASGCHIETSVSGNTTTYSCVK